MPDAATLLSELAQPAALIALGVLAGALAPTYYAAERLRGFGRAMVSRLPYEPPPGRDPEAAMVAAVDGETEADDGNKEE